MKEKRLIQITKDQIKKVIIDKLLVEIYDDIDDTDSFNVGYILCSSGGYYVVSSISPTGYYDGLFTINIDDIIKIQYNTNYIDKIQKLIKINNETKHFYTDKIFEDGIQYVLNYALDNKRILSIELCNSGFFDIVGFVKVINNEILIKEIDEYGFKSEIRVLNEKNITKIRTCSTDEIILEKLFNYNY